MVYEFHVPVLVVLNGFLKSSVSSASLPAKIKQGKREFSTCCL